MFHVKHMLSNMKYKRATKRRKKRIKKTLIRNTKRDMLFRKAKQHAKEKKRDEKTKGINRLLAACCFDSNRSPLGFPVAKTISW